MDWTEKLEHKKKIRKMAYRMLWADFKDVVFSWKVLLLLLMFLGFLTFPYFRDMEDFNAAGFYYFVMWIFMSLNALAETSFNYLPLSTKDIVYYMKVRTNHQEAWMVLISGVMALALDAAGVELFWERGIMVLIFLLVTVELTMIMTLSGCSTPEKISMRDAEVPLARRVRIVIYMLYGIVLLFGSMIVWLFMDPDQHARTKLLVVLCAYLVLYIFRADVAGWVKFTGYRRTPSRSMWGIEQQNPAELRDMLNQ